MIMQIYVTIVLSELQYITMFRKFSVTFYSLSDNII